MGIENLYSQWIRHYHNSSISSGILHPISVLLIDCNGILHDVAQETYKYGKHKADFEQIAALSDDELKNLYVKNLYAKFDLLMRTIKPTNSVVIAVDGVAPPSKLQQQRQRRYKEANGVTDFDMSKRFNSSAITPGTDFMFMIDQKITDWIVSKKKEYNIRFIYSSHLVHGEGEHKIFRILHGPDIDRGTNGYYAVYGLDADLVMLSLMSEYKANILLIRENIQDVVRIGSLATEIMTSMGNTHVCTIQDFVMFVYLVGNDFVPRIFTFSDIGDAIEKMMIIYKRTFSAPFTNEECKIDWGKFCAFLSLIADEEPELLKIKASYDYVYPSEILDMAAEKEEIKEQSRSKIKYIVRSFNYDLFRDLWYTRAFNPRMPSAQKYVELDAYSVADVSNMAKYYLFGLQWILYYYKGFIDSRYYSQTPPRVTPIIAVDYTYPYTYAPLLRDLVSELITLVASEKDLPLDIPAEPRYIGPHHQLVAVLPPMSRNLIPERQRHLVIASEISHMYPLTFDYYNEAKDNEFHKIPILPPLDIDQIIIEVNQTLEKGKIPFKDGVDMVYRENIVRRPYPKITRPEKSGIVFTRKIL